MLRDNDFLKVQIAVDLPAQVGIVSKLDYYSGLPILVIKGKSYPLAGADNVQLRVVPLLRVTTRLASFAGPRALSQFIGREKIGKVAFLHDWPLVDYRPVSRRNRAFPGYTAENISDGPVRLIGHGRIPRPILRQRTAIKRGVEIQVDIICLLALEALCLACYVP